MKKIITTVVLIFVFTCTNNLKSQASMDLFGIIPQPILSCKGWGIGWNLLSKDFPIGLKINQKKLEARFGGGFYISQLNRKKINNVPLDTPQVGTAKVSLGNYALGINAIARISYPYSEKIVPYIDVFGGIRSFSANMKITPNQNNSNYESYSSQSLSSFTHLNVGVTGGVMWSLSPYVKLNAGIVFTHSKQKGLIHNVNKALVESDALIVEEKFKTPNDFYMFNLGFTFLLKKSENNQTNRQENPNTNERTNRKQNNTPNQKGNKIKVNPEKPKKRETPEQPGKLD